MIKKGHDPNVQEFFDMSEESALWKTKRDKKDDEIFPTGSSFKLAEAVVIKINKKIIMKLESWYKMTMRDSVLTVI